MLTSKLFLCIGDSLTQYGDKENGWIQKFRTDYIRKADIINRGLAGYTSSHVLICLPYILEDYNPDLVTICLGANDARNIYKTLPNIFENNIKNMINLIRKKTNKIILISLPPIDEDVIKSRDINEERYNTDIKIYADIMKKVAHDEKIPFMYTFKTFLQTENFKDYFIDGLHFNDKGNKLFYDNLIETIKKYYPDLYINQTNRIFPSLGDIPEIKTIDDFKKYIDDKFN